MLKHMMYQFMSEKYLYNRVLKNEEKLKGELSEKDRLAIHDDLFAIMSVIIRKHKYDIDFLNEAMCVLDESIIETNEKIWRA